MPCMRLLVFQRWDISLCATLFPVLRFITSGPYRGEHRLPAECRSTERLCCAGSGTYHWCGRHRAVTRRGAGVSQGGTQQISQLLADRVGRHRIHLQHPVSSITQREDGAVTVTTTAGSSFHCESRRLSGHWTPQDPSGHLWTPLGTSGHLRTPLDTAGHLGHLRAPLDTCGTSGRI